MDGSLLLALILALLLLLLGFDLDLALGLDLVKMLLAMRLAMGFLVVDKLAQMLLLIYIRQYRTWFGSVRAPFASVTYGTY